MVTVLSTF